MQIGDKVTFKKDARFLGEVIAIDDYDRATVKLIGSGVEVIVHICDLMALDEVLEEVRKWLAS